MALKFATGFNSVLLYPVTQSSTYVEVSQTDAVAISNVLSSPGDFLFLEIINSLETYQPISEIIKVNSVVIQSSSGRLYCDRGQEGTVAINFPAGCFLRHVLAPSAITSFQPITIEAQGLTVNGGSSASISPGGTAALSVETPNISVSGGLSISGTWPNISLSSKKVNVSSGQGIAVQQSESGDDVEFIMSEVSKWNANYSFCGAVVNADAITPFTPSSFVSEGSVEGIVLNNTGSVIGVKVRNLPSGTYQRATVTVTNGRITAVETGADSSVSVSGVSGRTVVSTPLTGVYQVDLSPSGVNPGAYGPFVVDQYGRITAASGGTFVTSVQGSGAITASMVGGVVTVGASNATELSAGVVSLASPAQVAGGVGSGVVRAGMLRDGISAWGGVAQAPITAGSLGGPAATNVIASANIPPDCKYALVIGQISNTSGSYSASIYVGGVLHTSFPSADQRNQSVMAYVSVAGLAELRSTDPNSTGHLTIVPFK
jgi:hypothetical protein